MSIDGYFQVNFVLRNFNLYIYKRGFKLLFRMRPDDVLKVNDKCKLIKCGNFKYVNLKINVF